MVLLKNIQKTKFIYTLIFSIVYTITFAQNHYLGIKGGINQTQIKATNHIDNIEYRTCFNGGITYEFQFKKYFSAGVDVLYNQRGYKIKQVLVDNIGNSTGKTQIIKSNYDYISIPLKVGFQYGKSIYGFTNLGFMTSFLISAKTIFPSVELNGTTTPENTYNNYKNAKKVDLGGLLELGFGYQFKDKYCIYSSLAYQQSFTNLANENFKIHHYGYSINLGVKYSLVK